MLIYSSTIWYPAVISREIRMIRKLCRYENKLVSNRSSEKKRIQNSLTVSNLALANVVSDAFGKTASRIIEYVVNCDVFDPEHCKILIDGRIKASHDEVIIANAPRNRDCRAASENAK